MTIILNRIQLLLVLVQFSVLQEQELKLNSKEQPVQLQLLVMPAIKVTGKNGRGSSKGTTKK